MNRHRIKGLTEEQIDLLEDISKGLPELCQTTEKDSKFYPIRVCKKITGKQAKDLEIKHKDPHEIIKDDTTYIVGIDMHIKVEHFKRLVKAYKKGGAQAVERYKRRVYHILENLIMDKDIPPS